MNDDIIKQNNEKINKMKEEMNKKDEKKLN